MSKIENCCQESKNFFKNRFCFSKIKFFFQKYMVGPIKIEISDPSNIFFLEKLKINIHFEKKNLRWYRLEIAPRDKAFDFGESFRRFFGLGSYRPYVDPFLPSASNSAGNFFRIFRPVRLFWTFAKKIHKNPENTKIMKMLKYQHFLD